MEKNKLIGIALILIGIVFIVLGVMFGTPRVTNNTNIYSEQNMNNQNNQVNILDNNVNDSIYQETVDVYSEDAEEGSTRYIY